MMSKKAFSIKRHLIILTIGILVTMSAAGYLAADLYGQRAARLSYDRLLAGACLQIAESIRLSYGEVIVDLPRSAFKTLALAPEDRVFYSIVDDENKIVTGYPDLPKHQNTKSTFGDSIENETPFNYRFFTQEYKGEPIRFIYLRQTLNDVGLKKNITITIGQSLRARESLTSEIRLRAFQFIAIFFLIAIVVVSLAIRMMLLPLRKVNEELSSRSPVDLTALNISIPVELNPLVGTINHFMDQLNKTLDKLKIFTAIAAHQIRTPLAGLKSQAQNALDEPDDLIRRQQLIRIIECGDLLTETVNKLLQQAEVEHRIRRNVFEKVQLNQVVIEVCREVAVPAMQNGVSVSYLGDEEFTVSGDKFALKQMIRNILENAIKYSQEGDVVEADIYQQSDGDIVLAVSDSGPGIPIEDRGKVFEQFFRGTGTSKPGSGLGLSIAQEIAVHHGAKLILLDNTPRGLIVETHFQSTKHA